MKWKWLVFKHAAFCFKQLTITHLVGMLRGFQRVHSSPKVIQMLRQRRTEKLRKWMEKTGLHLHALHVLGICLQNFNPRAMRCNGTTAGLKLVQLEVKSVCEITKCLHRQSDGQPTGKATSIHMILWTGTWNMIILQLRI